MEGWNKRTDGMLEYWNNGILGHESKKKEFHPFYFMRLSTLPFFQYSMFLAAALPPGGSL